jgi:hypothetical protein
MDKLNTRILAKEIAIKILMDADAEKYGSEAIAIQHGRVMAAMTECMVEKLAPKIAEKRKNLGARMLQDAEVRARANEELMMERIVGQQLTPAMMRKSFYQIEEAKRALKLKKKKNQHLQFDFDKSSENTSPPKGDN